jgi:protein gp37
MGSQTRISWANRTFNPWEGCTAISPACDGCYAAARDRRLHGGRHWQPDGPRLAHVEQYWDNLRLWQRDAAQRGERQRVFVGSLCDIFEQRRDLPLQSLRERLWRTIPNTPDLIYMLTTKRPENIPFCVPMTWRSCPPANVWIIVTVEMQEYVWRIEAARDAMPHVRVVGVSAEPLLGRLDLDQPLSKGWVQWIIAGGESGARPRITEYDWVAHLRDQAVHKGIPFHFKQWGEWMPLVQIEQHQEPLIPDKAERSRGFVLLGAGKTGRMLDSREWLEVPDPGPTASAAPPYEAAQHQPSMFDSHPLPR